MPGSEAGYEPYNLFSPILTLIETSKIRVPTFAGTVPLSMSGAQTESSDGALKDSGLGPPVHPMEERERKHREGYNKMGTGRPRAPQVFEIPSSALRTIQV